MQTSINVLPTTAERDNHLATLFRANKRFAWLLVLEIRKPVHTLKDPAVLTYWYPGYCDSYTYIKWLRYPLRYPIPSLEAIGYRQTRIGDAVGYIKTIFAKNQLNSIRQKDIVRTYEKKTRYQYGADFEYYTDLLNIDAELCCIYNLIQFIQYVSTYKIPDEYYIYFNRKINRDIVINKTIGNITV